MSQKREVNSCPDGYRVLSTSELRELLQDETKMDKIVRLSEKVSYDMKAAPERAFASICPAVLLSFLLLDDFIY